MLPKNSKASRVQELSQKRSKKISQRLKSSKRSYDVNAAKRVPEIHAVQIAKGSKSPRCQSCQKVLDVKNPRAPPLRDTNVQEIHVVQITKRSKCPRASLRSPHYQKPSSFLQLHFLRCKRPIIGADKPSVVKENFVQAWSFSHC